MAPAPHPDAPTPLSDTPRTDPPDSAALPAVDAQAERLVELGVPELAGITADRLLDLAAELPTGPGLLAVDPTLVPTARLAELMSRDGKAGFVVVDMTDLAEFTPTDDIHLPGAPLYLVDDVTRGDDMLRWTPTDAHPSWPRAAAPR